MAATNFPSRAVTGGARDPGRSRPPVTALASHVLCSGEASRDRHAVLQGDLPAANRKAGDVLCKPSRRFQSLSIPCPEPVTCRACIVRAEHYGVILPGQRNGGAL